MPIEEPHVIANRYFLEKDACLKNYCKHHTCSKCCYCQTTTVGVGDKEVMVGYCKELSEFLDEETLNTPIIDVCGEMDQDRYFLEEDC